MNKSYAESVKGTIKVIEMEGPFAVDEDITVEYSVQSRESASDFCGEVIPTPPLLPENVLRFSARNIMISLEKVEDRAKAVNKKRDLEGTTSYTNSFAVLSDPELLLRANMMGVMIPDTDFSKVNILRELENFRNNAVEKDTPLLIISSLLLGRGTTYLLTLNGGMIIIVTPLILLLLVLERKKC